MSEMKIKFQTKCGFNAQTLNVKSAFVDVV